MKRTQTGKLVSRTSATRAKNVRTAGSQVKAKASINFTRSVRGR